MTDNVVLPITGEELQTLIATIKNGGIQGTGVNGYRFAMNSTTGKLELYKEDTLIAVQDDDGSWFKTAVSTGVGSLHLGGGASNTPSHSVSAAGQNVVFKSEAFNSDPNKAIVWFPAGWQGITADLTGLKPPTFLSFGSINDTFAPNGAVQAAGVAFDFSTTISTNICVASVTCVAHEAYSGVIKNIIRATATNSETHESSATINVTAGQPFTVTYPACYFARENDNLRLQMIKADGQPLMVRRGTTNAAQPWRALRVRTFTDVSIAPQSGWAANRNLQTDALGNAVAASELTGLRAIVSDANGLPVASAATSGEVAVLSGSSANSNVTPVDADKFIINDAGVMKQTSFSSLWGWISSKLPAQGVRVIATANMPASGESNTDLVADYKGFKIWVNISSTNAKIFTARTDNGEMIIAGYLYAVGTLQWNKQSGAIEVVSISKGYGNTGGKVGRFLFNTSPAGNGSPIVAEISLVYVDTDKVTYHVEVY